MQRFVFTEDRNEETGHGWRDHPHVLEVATFRAGADGEIMACFLDADGKRDVRRSAQFAVFSYAWITTRESWETTKFAAADELRTSDIRAQHPDFRGADDMEGHFAFAMSPEDMREYLMGLGMENTAHL